MSEEYREEFLDTNKKNKLQNPSGNRETNLMILINLISTCGLLYHLRLFMDYLGLKDSSRDFAENCAISFFFVYI